MDLSSFFPPSLLDQSFGLCISPEDLIFPSYNFHRTSYYRPWKWYMQRAEKDFGSSISDEKEKFKIALDVQHFQPNEINVKVADREVIIEGKHEERQDNHGFISRQFKRRYFLPHDCNADSVFSTLSSDGVLTITADKMKEIKNKEIIVPIKMCETCPNKELKVKIEKKELVTDEIKKTDTENCKKNMEIMLKEDHCCLLRPELLGTLSGTEKIQISKEGSSVAKSDQTTNIEASKMDVACGQASATMTEKNVTCGLSSKGICETVASGLSTLGKTETSNLGMISSDKTAAATSGIISTGKVTAAASEMTCAGKIDTASGMISTGTAENTVTLCGLSSSGKVEKGETLLCGLSSAGKMQEAESVACGITSEVLTEKAETCAAAKSETCNYKSMLNESIQIQESSSSYSSSMASSIKETTEKISEIVSDISAQLKEAAENI